MKPFRLLLAAPFLLASSPALAVSTGPLTASTTIAFACDMTLPGNIVMTPVDASTSSGSDTMPYAQNAGTTYTLSALTVTHPASAPLVVGSLTFVDKDATQVVTNSSESTTAAGNIVGVESGTGTIVASVVDTVLAAGDYTIAGTITCSESP